MIEPYSPEWFAARVGCPTASMADDLLSDGRGKDPQPGAAFYSAVHRKVWEVLANCTAPQHETAAMRRGLDLEPIALARYAAETGRIVSACGLTSHPMLPRFKGTPDGIVDETPRRIVQVKCPFSAERVVAIGATRDVAEYVAQIQAEMLITGAAVADLVVYDDRLAPPDDLIVIEIAADREMQAKLLDRAHRFCAEVDARVLAYRQRAA